MRFTWFSNAPWAPTGYGNQTRLFVPRLKRLGHEIAIIAFWGLEGGMINWEDIPIYPKGLEQYGQDVLGAHTAHYRTNVCISLLDAWVFRPDMYPGTLWIPWFPVDMQPIPPPVLRQIKRAFERIVFSRFAERMVREAGLDCYYVPHGVDTSIFRPYDEAKRREWREKLGWPQDKFIVGMVAANKGTPSRKAFAPQLEAFAHLRRKHDDVFLYLHTTAGEHGEHGGMNLPEYLNYLGLVKDQDYVFCDRYHLLLGFPDEYMVAAYNAMDVHLLVSMGEGFGIPILEAQACGTPVITGEWTAMKEITFSGWKVPRSEADAWWTPLASYQFMPRSGAILECLEKAYHARGNQDYRKRARDGALRYDADRVVEKYWKPVLAEIEEKVSLWQPKSVS